MISQARERKKCAHYYCTVNNLPAKSVFSLSLSLLAYLLVLCALRRLTRTERGGWILKEQRGNRIWATAKGNNDEDKKKKVSCWIENTGKQRPTAPSSLLVTLCHTLRVDFLLLSTFFCCILPGQFLLPVIDFGSTEGEKKSERVRERQDVFCMLNCFILLAAGEFFSLCCKCLSKQEKLFNLFFTPQLAVISSHNFQ